MRAIRILTVLLICAGLLFVCVESALHIEPAPVTDDPEPSPTDRERFLSAFSSSASLFARSLLPGAEPEWISRLVMSPESRNTAVSLELNSADVFDSSFLGDCSLMLSLSAAFDPGTGRFYGSADATDGPGNIRAAVSAPSQHSVRVEYEDGVSFVRERTMTPSLPASLLSDSPEGQYTHSTVPYRFCDRFIPNADCDSLALDSTSSCHPFRLLYETMFPDEGGSFALKEICFYTCAGNPIGADFRFVLYDIPMILRCDAEIQNETGASAFRARLYPDDGSDPGSTPSIGSLDISGSVAPSGAYANGTVSAELTGDYFSLLSAQSAPRPGSPDSVSVSLTFSTDMRYNTRITNWEIGSVTRHNAYQTETKDLHAVSRTDFSEGFRTVIRFDGPFSELDFIEGTITVSDTPADPASIPRFSDAKDQDPEATETEHRSFSERLSDLIFGHSYSLWTILYRQAEPLPAGESFKVYSAGYGSMVAACFPFPFPENAFSCAGQYERTASWTASANGYYVRENGSEPYEIIPGQNGVSAASYHNNTLHLQKGGTQWFFDSTGTVRILDRVQFRFGKRLDSSSRLLTVSDSRDRELLSDVLITEEPDGFVMPDGTRFSRSGP